MKERCRRFWLFAGCIPFLITTGCKGTLFQEIGNQLASPIAVAVDTANLRAYVVNSNNNFEFTSATLSILDITDPAAPVLLDSPVNPITLPNYSGQIYFDPVTFTAYIPNRASDNTEDTTDALLTINLDEASSDFGKITEFAAGENPFGIVCCDAGGRIYVVNSGGSTGTLQTFDPANLATSVQTSLQLTLSSGDTVSGKNSTEAAFLGTQAFVTNRGGNIYVINTTDVGDTLKNPIDYIITSLEDLRGIATDGTSLFVVDGTLGSEALLVLNPATLIPVNPDTSTVSEVDISTLQSTSITVGEDPNEVLVFNGKAYVSNRGDDTVSVIDLTTNTVTATISVGDEPFGLTAFTVGPTNYLYVTNLLSNSISIIDLSSNTVVTTFEP